MIKPMEDRLLIQIEKPEERNEMGLIIPATARDKEQEGIVVAVGPGRYKDGEYTELPIKVGDRVFFGPQHGVEIKQDNEKFYIFSYNQIQAVLAN